MYEPQEVPSVKNICKIHSQRQISDVTLSIFQPVILQLSIDTNIRFRYARTEVATRVSNAANISQEVSFSFVIPESAYISGFQM